MENKLIGAIAVVALVLSVWGVWHKDSLVSNGKPNFGATTAGTMYAENYIPYVLYNGGYNSAKDINTSAFLGTTGTFSVGSTGSTVSGLQFGSCVLTAYSTIAATTTKDLDCPVTGALSTDTVLSAVFASSTYSSTVIQGGVFPISVRASTTAGFITVTVINLTGATYTFGGTGFGSTTKYIILR